MNYTNWGYTIWDHKDVESTHPHAIHRTVLAPPLFVSIESAMAFRKGCVLAVWSAPPATAAALNCTINPGLTKYSSHWQSKKDTLFHQMQLIYFNICLHDCHVDRSYICVRFQADYRAKTWETHTYHLIVQVLESVQDVRRMYLHISAASCSWKPCIVYNTVQKA